MNEEGLARFGPQRHRKKKLRMFIIVRNRKLKQTFELPPSCYLSFSKHSALTVTSCFPHDLLSHRI